MSDQTLKTFIFTEKQSGRIIYLKKSRGLDFSIHGRDWICNELVIPEQIPNSVVGTHKWDASSGLQPVSVLSGQDLSNFRLLQKKLEILTALRANLHVIWLQAKPSFSHKKLLSTPVQGRNFKKLWRLVTHEKNLLRRRMAIFFEDVRAKVEAAPTIEKLEADYQHIVNNVTLGGYAASSRDIEGNHAKGN